MWRWESDTFGSTLPDEDPDKDGVKVTVNLRFGGYYADIESGLFYAKHRYYSPLIWEFTQADRLDLLRRAVNPLYAGYSEPTDLMRGLNQPYNYAGGNPLKYIDPKGLSGEAAENFPTDEGQPPVIPTNQVHGYWCGPDWTGGRRGEYSPANASLYTPPKDNLDNACKNHDICYWSCRNNNPCDPEKRSQCFARCDAGLAEGALGQGADGILVRTAMRRPGKRASGPNATSCQCSANKK